MSNGQPRATHHALPRVIRIDAHTRARECNRQTRVAMRDAWQTSGEAVEHRRLKAIGSRSVRDLAHSEGRA